VRVSKRMIENHVICIKEPEETIGTLLAQYLDPDGLAISFIEERKTADHYLHRVFSSSLYFHTVSKVLLTSSPFQLMKEQHPILYYLLLSRLVLKPVRLYRLL